MKIKILIVVLFATFMSKGQSTISPENAIAEIKEGTLIVNLIWPTKKIELLLKSGKKEESLALEKSIKQEHQQIINAFAANYHFGKVLFVRSTNLGDLADNNPTVLFSASGNSQSSMPNHYYLVEFSTTDGRSLTGFVVRDHLRDPLAKPFPYFVSYYKMFGLKKRSFVEMTIELDKRFNTFYNSVAKQ